MALPADIAALAAARRRAQQRVTARVWALIRPLWGRLDAGAVLASWDGVAARPALTLLTAGQMAAAAGAQAYVADVLHLQGADADPFGAVAESALAGVASDGRDLASLLRQPAQDTVRRLAAGMPADEALRQGLGQLERIARTQTVDAGRVATGVATVNDRAARGYVRMLTAPSCARCVILAGRWYAANAGFDRHPLCDCVGVPAAEDVAGDWTTSPKAYFGRLSPAEQDQTFGQAGARAIRDGADMGRVVNARRGIYTAGGRTLTREAAGRRPRPMPEQIYLDAGDDRDEALRQLKRFGYLL